MRGLQRPYLRIDGGGLEAVVLIWEHTLYAMNGYAGRREERLWIVGGGGVDRDGGRRY